jgi:REP element-mobilizing transposase RayT
LRYFITFACYGARLHGDEAGSVDRDNNQVGNPWLAPDSNRAAAEQRSMLQEPYLMDQAERATVLIAVQEHCACRGWKLWAAHVRTNHVHAIVEADVRPEKIMSEFISYASRALNRFQSGTPERRRWARHGSTRWLWKDQDVKDAIKYVIDEQGEAMAMFVAAEF